MNKIRKIADYGELYLQQYLTDQIRNKETFICDWFNALEFFFSKSFFRGRNDDLSDRFLNAAILSVREFKPSFDTTFDEGALDSLLISHGVNNHIDRQMVTATCEFVLTKLNDWNRNIVRYAIEEITNGHDADLSDNIKKIHGVKDKLAPFFLRDVALIYGLEHFLTQDDYKYFQPIDTWVRRVARELQLSSATDKDDVVKEKIIGACIVAGASPLLFNAGAWLTGKNSLKLLIENLCHQSGG